MLYRIYIYGTTAATGSAPAVSLINRAIRTGIQAKWQDEWADKFLKEFDTEYIVGRINEMLTDPATGQCSCNADVKYPPSDCIQAGYIYIAATYENAPQVLPRLCAIAAENDLVLYDAETGKSFYRDMVDITFITMKRRQQELQQAISKEMKPVWSIRRLQFYEDERDKLCSYAVTLRKKCDVSFEERNIQFYECLKRNLQNGEGLECENQYYSIKGEWYTINFVLEGYKKHPDKIGYVEDGKPCTALLHRMGADEAYRSIASLTGTEKNDIFCRMNFNEMRKAYPNPAQRFVESVKITKWQRKQIFDVRYSDIGSYGSEILFHKVADEFYDDSSKISVLKIEEDSASFILPFVEDIYPYFSRRCYLDENHIPYQMLEDIAEKLEEAVEMLLHDTFNPSLAPYINRFCLNVVEPDWERINKTDKVQLVYEHRYEVAGLLEVFIRWARSQLEIYCDSDLFNIQGP